MSDSLSSSFASLFNNTKCYLIVKTKNGRHIRKYKREIKNGMDFFQVQYSLMPTKYSHFFTID